MTRIVVCIDVSTDDPVEAYRRVKRAMDEAFYASPARAEFDGWESSDEWYADDGRKLDEDTVQGARMRVFEEKETGGRHAHK
jgi:hypothetical protein